MQFFCLTMPPSLSIVAFVCVSLSMCLCHSFVSVLLYHRLILSFSSSPPVFLSFSLCSVLSSSRTFTFAHWCIRRHCTGSTDSTGSTSHDLGTHNARNCSQPAGSRCCPSTVFGGSGGQSNLSCNNKARTTDHKCVSNREVRTATQVSTPPHLLDLYGRQRSGRMAYEQSMAMNESIAARRLAEEAVRTATCVWLNLDR